MGNDIEIRVRVANNTAAGVTAVNRSMDRLRDSAREAGRGLDGLAARATIASAALRELRDSAQDTGRALRSLNTTARTSDTRLAGLSDRSRTLRRDTDDLDGSMRRLGGTLGDLRGNNGRLNATFGDSGNSMQRLKAAAIALSPALIPIAASAAPIAVSMAAAGVAVGAFGLAVAGQLVAVKNAADAEKKYQDAVKKHGAASSEAAQAESEYLSQVRQMDPVTRKAAASLSVLKDQYKGWSKGLAGDTMPVVTKGLAVFGALMPKLTPVVKGASGELNRFMTILGGGISSSGFDKFMDSFAKFSTGALSRANDGLVRFMRTMSGGAGSSQFTEFMAYAQKVGPQVGETLSNLARAMVHLVAAASETGVGLLSIVNAFAQLVNALPTSLLSSLLQFALVMKTVRLAAAGLGAAGGGLTAFMTSLGAMRTAAAGASGGLGRLSAAFGALSTGAKFGAIGAGVGLLVVGLVQLSKYGKAAPPDIDKLTTSLGKLGSSGKASGEAARLFGKDLGSLYEAIRNISDPTTTDKIQQWMVKIGSLGIADSSPHTEAKEKLDGIDEALTNLARGGKAKIAAQAFKDLSAAYVKSGGSAGDFKKAVDGYNSTVADQAFEARLAAEGMGLFGQQALSVKTKLDAQKASADGLRQSIQALNDVNRQGLGGMIGFEAAIDAAATAAKKNAGALSMSGGVLNLNSEKARSAASALQDLASRTDEAAGAARESGSSWETVNGIYARGRTALIRNAQAMGLNKEQAAQLADQILKIPNKTARFKMNTEDAKAGLNAFNAALKRSPGSKSVTLKTLSRGAEQILESFGLKVKRLPNGKVTVTTRNGQALSAIRNVAGALNALDGTSAHTSVTTTYKNIQTFRAAHGRASGGLAPGYADGGPVVQTHPNGGLISGPGSGTSDSVTEVSPNGGVYRTSNREYIVQESAVRKYGVGMLDALNAGRLKLAGFAKGGMPQGMKDARASLRNQFGISRFGSKAGYERTPFEKALGAPSDLGALVSALNGFRSEIKKATGGRTESRLLKQLDSIGKGLIKYEKHLTKVTASLEKAKSKLDDLKSSAAQLRDSVKSGVLSSANITRGAGADKTVTVGSIMGGLTASRDKATAFSGALKSLKGKGLSKALLQQIAEAGIEGGGLETAGALMGASKSEIGSLNSLQSQIGKAATSAGKTTADAVYGAVIKAQQKLVDSLKKQQDKLEKAMAHLAKVMEKSISKAVGKKAAGGIVGAAASGGLRGGLTWTGEQGPELLDLPVGSRVWSNADSRRKAAAGGGGVVRVELEIHSSGSSAYGEFLAKEFRKFVRVRGGNVQVALMGRA